jgi:tRNA A37 threonylcarbamoyladenosine biosynthesis protein TsaE
LVKENVNLPKRCDGALFRRLRFAKVKVKSRHSWLNKILVSKIKHIAVAGNIGSGKTTLTEKLAKHYNWTPLFESVDHNPYLRDFYEDMTRWAFHLQIYFLNSRFTQVRQIRESENLRGCPHLLSQPAQEWPYQRARLSKLSGHF